ncbi:myelin expression factor 2-like protein [Labeo rohita]|uniref:Myelin expression factor 2-like protein n=1 Tax=Labeo rohita TaxID=84645 RepID=A0A498M698_LABRO|nr:myelin expression factor 2-like protein [Labeo rohita]
MADAELTLDLTDSKHEESGDSPTDEGDAEPQQTQENTNGVKTDAEEKPEPKEKSRKSHRYHPYKERHGGGGSADKKAAHRNRVFISNIPYDMKWQAIKDLMREKVGEVTYVELFKDGEGKSRVSDSSNNVVEFKDEEFVKKAIEVMSKHDLNGRPLNIKEDPDGEHARRVLQRSGRMYGGGRGQDTGPTGMNVPPSIANNPNIPPEIISALQAGRLGTTVFVANLDFKVGWKKLKEVFSMAGTVRRADVKEDKDGKSRGMGTVTFEQPLEAVQAISMFNGQMLFDRQMHVKMDDKSLPPDDFRPAEKPPQLPRGLGGVGMGLGPGGQPINANRLSGGAVGSMGPGGMDGPGCSNMNRMSGGGYTGMGNAGMGPMGSGLGGGGMVNMGMDRMNSGFDRMGGNMDMGRGFGQYGGGSGHMGGMSDRGVGSKAGCQIFVRNLSYDLTWQKLKEKFSHCGQVMYAEIKMENGKSKGCGTVRFDSPESAEKACRMMNGTKINGREVDVRIDRNA